MLMHKIAEIPKREKTDPGIHPMKIYKPVMLIIQAIQLQAAFAVNLQCRKG